MDNYPTLEMKRLGDFLFHLGHWDTHKDQQRSINSFLEIVILKNTNKNIESLIGQLPKYARDLLEDPIFSKAYHFNNRKILRNFESMHHLPIGGAFVMNGIVQEVMQFIINNYGGFLSIWIDLNGFKGNVSINNSYKTYTWSEFYQKVTGDTKNMKSEMRKFQGKLKRSPYWMQDIKPAEEKARIHKLSAKPSFIHEYRKYITDNYTD